MQTTTEITARIEAKKAEIAAAVADFDWEHPKLDAELEALEAELVKATAREQRQKEDDQNKQSALEWADKNPGFRGELSDKIRAYLRSANGRLGESAEGIAGVVSNSWVADSQFQDVVNACLDRLVKVRAIRKDPDDKYWNPKAYYHEHPNSKKRSGAVQNIGTYPDAVFLHKGMTPARLAVASALSRHFYATRRSHAKARAIGNRDLAKAAHVRVGTVRAAIDWLKKQGLLDYDKAIGSRPRVYRWTAKTKVYRKRPVPIS